MDKLKHHVRVNSAEDDGHSWRKYGQKDILGAQHPRLVLAHFRPFSEPNPHMFSDFLLDSDTVLVLFHGWKLQPFCCSQMDGIHLSDSEYTHLLLL